MIRWVWVAQAKIVYICDLYAEFYKGLFGDSINVMLVAAAYNLIRAVRLLLCLLQTHALSL